MDEISVKLQAAVSDTKIFMAKQRDEIERLRGVVGTFSVAPNEATLRAEQAREIRRLESIIETFAGTNDELAQKDAEIARLSSENAMLRSGDAYLVGEAVCGSFTAACDAAITMGVPVTILKSVYQPVCQWVPA